MPALFRAAHRERAPEADVRKSQEQAKHKHAEINKAAMIECVELVKASKVTLKVVAAYLRLQLDRELEFSPAHEDYCKRNSLPVGSAVANQVARRNLNELLAMLVEFVIAEGGFSYDELDSKNRAWLEIFGINYDKVVKQNEKAARKTG